MIRFMKENLNKIPDLVRIASGALHLSESVIEKDLWVTYFLDYLFSRCPYKDAFEFKGGTSLSKCFALIDRFSEDLDIVIAPNEVGMNLLPLLQSGTSRNKREVFTKEINEKAMEYLSNKLIPIMKKDCEGELGTELYFQLEKDELAFYIAYPSAFSDYYVRPRVKLEMSCLSALIPSEKAKIAPLLFKTIPALDDGELIHVRALSPSRTFWEKAMILHQEAHRISSPTPRRYSRHYYDLCKIRKSKLGDKIVSDKSLMEEVRQFTIAFYNRSWAKFEEAKPGTFRLLPNEYQIDGLRADYREMEKMIFDVNRPSFQDILEDLKRIEDEINQAE